MRLALAICATALIGCDWPKPDIHGLLMETAKLECLSELVDTNAAEKLFNRFRVKSRQDAKVLLDMAESHCAVDRYLEKIRDHEHRKQAL